VPVSVFSLTWRFTEKSPSKKINKKRQCGSFQVQQQQCNTYAQSHSHRLTGRQGEIFPEAPVPVAVSTFNARIDRCRSGGDHILVVWSVVWCGGLTRPDPTPIILAVSLTSGFPRHPARAPTSYQTDAAMIPRFPPPPPAPHVVARQLAAPPRPRPRRPALVRTRVAAIKARGGDPCNQSHCHHCCPRPPTPHHTNTPYQNVTTEAEVSSV
jgi:hypothetical protein